MKSLPDQPMLPMTPASPPSALPPDASLRNSLRDIARNLVISGAIPLLLYAVLTGRGVSTVPALGFTELPE